MIEFKAECGHTVRARDEDAGGVVRCSYCGRNAGVPESGSADLDFLFNEVQQTAEPETGGWRRKRRKGKPLFARKKRTSGEFNPFAVVLRLCYAAVLIIIVVVVVKMVVIPMLNPQKWTQMFGGAGPTAPPSKRDDASSKAPVRTRGPGLRDTKITGLYVASSPAGATVYCLEESKAPAIGRIHQVKGGCTPFRTPGESPHLADGSYIIEVALPLSEPTFKKYPYYVDFRKQLLSGSNDQRLQLAKDYFLPDEASNVYVDETEEPPQIVRQYRSVTVQQGRSKGVRALFLPKRSGKGAGPLRIEDLVSGYLPEAINYEFDQANIRAELEIYGVSEADQPWVVKALLRIGVMPYTTPDHNVRLFKIGIHDGVLSNPVIGKASE